MSRDTFAEPAITINGVALTTAQAMTVRVALGSFALSLQAADSLGEDEHGKAMTKGYNGALREIFRLMALPQAVSPRAGPAR
jgi:hypothetical protein